MNTKSNNSMEAVLREIVRLRGPAVLADGRMLVSMYCDLSSEKKDQRLLRYFTECGGHTDLLEAKTLSPAMQKTRFNQTVSKMCAETLVSEEAARQVCNAFWSAVYGKPMEEIPVQSQQKQEPQPQKTPQPQNIQQVQRIQPEPTPQRPVPPTPPKQSEPVRRKNDFYITEREYESGGKIAIYYADGSKEIVNFPRYAKPNQKGLPHTIHPGRGIDSRHRNQLENYSDERLLDFASYGYFTKSIKSALSGVCYGVLPMIGVSLLINLLIPTAGYVADWLAETLFHFDLIRGIIISGFSFSQLLELNKAYFESGYSFKLDNIGSWFFIICIFAQIVLTLVLIWSEFRENLDMRRIVQAEIERRKRL